MLAKVKPHISGVVDGTLPGRRMTIPLSKQPIHPKPSAARERNGSCHSQDLGLLAGNDELHRGYLAPLRNPKVLRFRDYRVQGVLGPFTVVQDFLKPPLNRKL